MLSFRKETTLGAVVALFGIVFICRAKTDKETDNCYTYIILRFNLQNRFYIKHSIINLKGMLMGDGGFTTRGMPSPPHPPSIRALPECISLVMNGLACMKFQKILLLYSEKDMSD